MSVTPFSAAIRVTVLDDDVLLRDHVLLPLLAAHGYRTAGMSCAVDLAALPADAMPHILLLDLGLPEGDGLQVTEAVRRHHPRMGVVVLTGRLDTRERVRGLLDGADACLVKPVDPSLLLATLHSVIRRLHAASVPLHGAPGTLHSRAHGNTGRWQLAIGAWHLLAPCGRAVALTSSERPVMRCLFGSAGEVVSRDRLIAALTSDVYHFDTHRLDSLIHRLRRKVAGICDTALPLTTVPKQGYVFLP